MELPPLCSGNISGKLFLKICNPGKSADFPGLFFHGWALRKVACSLEGKRFRMPSRCSGHKSQKNYVRFCKSGRAAAPPDLLFHGREFPAQAGLLHNRPMVFLAFWRQYGTMDSEEDTGGVFMGTISYPELEATIRLLLKKYHAEYARCSAPMPAAKPPPTPTSTLWWWAAPASVHGTSLLWAKSCAS